MNHLQQKKLHQLYLFIKAHGYNVSMDAMAQGINVTPKTLFNRYQNKENMENTVQRHWYNLFWEHFQEKQKQCNNAIEQLIILACDIKASATTEKIFFDKALNAPNQWDNNFKSIFLTNTQSIIAEGISKNLFLKEHLKSNFGNFLLFNFCTLLLQTHFKAELIQFLFSPLLTDYGKVIFNEINIESFIN